MNTSLVRFSTLLCFQGNVDCRKRKRKFGEIKGGGEKVEREREENVDYDAAIDTPPPTSVYSPD